jgi:DNA-binding NarL/FixJ family response regulator
LSVRSDQDLNTPDSSAPQGTSTSASPQRHRSAADHPRIQAKGLSYKEIASRLFLSHRTVQNHVQNTLRKLQLHNRVQLVRYAIEQGLDDS